MVFDKSCLSFEVIIPLEDEEVSNFLLNVWIMSESSGGGLGCSRYTVALTKNSHLKLVIMGLNLVMSSSI